MTVFSQLLSMYKKNGASATPKEDFCTECLAGILRSDHELLEEFAKSVLKIKYESPLKVSAQRTFYSKKNGDQGRIDLVFESQDVLCFVEMKVHSAEGYGQLEKYDQILSEQPNTVSTHLRYCTLYNEEKENFKNFDQFRWQDIARFLKTKVAKNHLIQEFYNFLKENKMAGNERFTHEDLVGLKVYHEIASKIDGVFTSVKPSLEKFGTTSGGANSGSQITKHNRLAVYSSGILGDNWSEVLVSFDFIGIRYKNEPVIAVQIFISTKNSNYKKFVEAASKYYQNKQEEGKIIFKKSEHGKGAHIRYEKPLALFFSEEEQLKAIQDWIEDKLISLMDFVKDHPNLDWKIKGN